MTGAAAIAWSGWTAAAVAWEAYHRHRIGRVPHRVLVSGMRGKTTAVRLVRAGFEAATRRVLSRETGDRPLTVLPDGSEAALRRTGPANIREMRRSARQAAALNCDALCFENMAIRPELAKAVATHAVRPTCALFTFDGRDHGEAYPADADDRAEMLVRALTRDVPVVVCDSPRNRAVRERLMREGFEVLAPTKCGVRTLRPHVRALAGAALAVLERCGVEGEAVERAVTETADGLQRLRVAEHDGHELVDLLSVNDPDSVAELVATFRSEGLMADAFSLVYAHRNDRPERLAAFASLLQRHDGVVTGDVVPRRWLDRNGLRFVGDHDEAIAGAGSATVLVVGNSNGAGATIRARYFGPGETRRW